MKIEELLTQLAASEQSKTGYVVLASEGEYKGATEEERTFFFQSPKHYKPECLYLSSYTDNRYPHHVVKKKNVQLDRESAKQMIEDCGYVTFMLLEDVNFTMSVADNFFLWKDAYENMKKRLAAFLDLDVSTGFEPLAQYVQNGKDVQLNSRSSRTVNRRKKSVCSFKIITILNGGENVKIFE